MRVLCKCQELKSCSANNLDQALREKPTGLYFIRDCLCEGWLVCNVGQKYKKLRTVNSNLWFEVGRQQ